MFSLSLILLSILNAETKHRRIKHAVKELVAKRGLFRANVLRKELFISGVRSSPLPLSNKLSLFTGSLNQFCAISTFQQSGYLKCQDIYSAYVW